MTRVLIACGLLILAQPASRYQFDAAGRAVRIDQTWELRAGFDAIDIFTAFARCGRQLFLGDTQTHVFRVDANQPVSTLAPFAGENRGIGRPRGLLADCARRQLHVNNSGPKTIVTLDLESGAALSSRPYQPDLYPASSAMVLAAPDTLMIAGLWNSNTKLPLPNREAATFFEQTSIGQRVSLSSGAVSPGLAPYETKCPAAGACQTSDFDAIGEGTPRGWIASLGISTKVALYDAKGTRTSTIDVTSPRFKRDGTEMPVKSRVEDYERWRSRNSVIRRVFSIGRYFVVVHSITVIGPKWVFGEIPQLEVFMNIYGADGTPLVSDVRLPDQPIGRDATHLYAIDYGPDGRGQSSERVRLVRIPVEAGAAIVRNKH
jgi:hypothetical protein